VNWLKPTLGSEEVLTSAVLHSLMPLLGEMKAEVTPQKRLFCEAKKEKEKRKKEVSFLEEKRK
jgi:hypothetical protein